MNTPKIHELKQDEAWPDRHADFYWTGDRGDAVQACARDYASCQCWDYIIGECLLVPGLWYIWQEEKGGAEA